MRIVDIQDKIDHELLSHDQIMEKISEDYAGRVPLLVCVLKGAVNTLTAFSQAMSIPLEMDFMSLSSYGSGTSTSGKVTVRQDLSTDVRGRDVVIVEDIVDSGVTLARQRIEAPRCGFCGDFRAAGETRSPSGAIGCEV